MRPLQLLIIDDDPESARALQRLLRIAGHSSTLTGTIAGAREALANEQFDLLLSDVHLPDGNAIDLIQSMRGKVRCPAIAVSGRMDLTDYARCRQGGFHDCLRKPVLFGELMAAIERVMTPWETKVDEQK